MSDLAQRCLGARTASAEVNIVADEPAKPGSELTDEYFRLLDLSSELRLLVYEAYIGNAVWQIDDKKSYLTCGPLRSVCKLILNEFDPLYTQAQWQIRCIEADVKSFNFGRLIEFPGDDVCDDSYCSPQDETLSTEIDPFVINITMTFEHQLSVEPHCNYAYQDTLEPWLALHAAHGSNWHFTYGPRFMLSEDESPRRYVACLTMGNCWRIQCAVTSREQSMRPTSSTGQIMQDIIRSAARVCIVSSLQLSEVSTPKGLTTHQTLWHILTEAVPIGYWNGWKCEGCVHWRTTCEYRGCVRGYCDDETDGGTDDETGDE